MRQGSARVFCVAAVALGCTGAIEGSAQTGASASGPGGALSSGAGGGAGASSVARDPGSAATGAGGLAPAPVGSAPFVPGPTVVRRLTATQFRNCLRGALGVELPAELSLEPDRPAEGLREVGASVANVSELGAELYQDAALAAAAQAFGDAKRRAALMPCTPTGPADAVCARRVVELVGLRLWRRPLTAAEADRMTAATLAAAGMVNDFTRAAELVTAGMIQSPKFLFRVEVGERDPAAPGRLRYTGYEMASRLSFLLWNSGPDTDLLEAARRGELATAEGVRAQAARMLASPEARAAVVDFFDDVLAVGEVLHAQKDAKAFPLFSASLAAAMVSETRRMIENVVFARQADVREILTTRTTFVNASLARLYGLTAPSGTAPVETELPADGMRRGLLGQASILARFAYDKRTGPTIRGRFVREQLLCTKVPDPPADIDTSLPPSALAAKTERERLAAHRDKGPVCASCHGFMDPIGLGLENFDGIGAFRATENGAVIDPSGELDGKPFKDARELGEQVAQHPGFLTCVLSHLYRQASGRSPVEGEQVVLADLGRRFGAASNRLTRVLVDLAASDGFRYARAAQ